MNKEQKTPQEECYCHCHCRDKSDCVGKADREHCQHCQEPQEEWERDLETERLITGKNKNSISYVCPTHGSSIYMPLENTCKDCKLYVSGEDIRLNFIAKCDLRKLLEGKKKQLSQYDDDEKGLYDDAWNYNLTIDDIQAESEKL